MKNVVAITGVSLVTCRHTATAFVNIELIFYKNLNLILTLILLNKMRLIRYNSYIFPLRGRV